MSQELLNDNSIRLTEYNLIDFTFAVAELGARGFVPTLLNGSHPEGGFGSYYSAILVPRHHYRIDLQGNHLNVPETPTEVPVNEATSSVVSVKATTTEQPVKQATTRAKKTT